MYASNIPHVCKGPGLGVVPHNVDAELHRKLDRIIALLERVAGLTASDLGVL